MAIQNYRDLTVTKIISKIEILIFHQQNHRISVEFGTETLPTKLLPILYFEEGINNLDKQKRTVISIATELIQPT